MYENRILPSCPISRVGSSKPKATPPTQSTAILGMRHLPLLSTMSPLQVPLSENKLTTAYPSSFLNGDSRLLIVAGSDTTAATLTHVFYHLCASPSAITTLRQELADISYTPGSENEVRDLQDAKYLDGIIHETLRLHPPVPSGLMRVTPPEGLVLKTGGGEKGGKGLQKEVWIPGGVTVSTPTWSMGRCKFSTLLCPRLLLSISPPRISSRMILLILQ